MTDVRPGTLVKYAFAFWLVGNLAVVGVALVTADGDGDSLASSGVVQAIGALIWVVAGGLLVMAAIAKAVQIGVRSSRD